MSEVVELDQDSSDDEVQLVEDPLKRLQEMNAFQVASDILSGRKYQSPSVAEQRVMLSNIVAEKGENYFPLRSKELSEFNAIKQKVNSGWKTTTARDKMWTVLFVAKHLSMLLIIYKSVKDSRTKAASTTTRNTRSGKGDGGGKKKAAQSNDKLKRLLKAVYKKYETCHRLHEEAEAAALNKKHRTPSLQYNLGGRRPQDLVPWGTHAHDWVNCPVCLNNTTQALENVADVNAENENARARLQRDPNWDGRFTGKSATHGCYAHEFDCNGDPTGKGCPECEEKVKNGVLPSPNAQPGDCPFSCNACASDCCVSFSNCHRQTIANSIVKTKEQEEKKQASQPTKSSKAQIGLSTFGGYLMDNFNNNMLREHQHVDGRTEEEKMQDASARTALELSSSDLATDPDVRRGLQRVISRTTTIQPRDDISSKAAPMSVQQARATMKGNKKSKKDNTPPNSNFTSNKNNSYVPPPPNASNRAHRNGLSNNPVDPYRDEAPQGSYGWNGYTGPMYGGPPPPGYSGYMGGAG